MKKLTTLLLSLFCFVSFSQTPSVQKSAPLQSASAAEAGMSQERLDKIGNMLEQAVNEKQIPGVVASLPKMVKSFFMKLLVWQTTGLRKPWRKTRFFVLPLRPRQ